MKCKQVRQKFADISDEKMVSPELDCVREHLDACKLCSQDYESYMETSGQLSERKVYIEKFGRSADDFFMVSLRRRINGEVLQKQKHQLAFWALFGKIQVGLIVLLVVGQVVAYEREVFFKKRIDGLLEQQQILEKQANFLRQELIAVTASLAQARAEEDQRPVTGDRRPATGDQRPVTADRGPETGDQGRGTGNGKRGAGNEERGTRDEGRGTPKEGNQDLRSIPKILTYIQIQFPQAPRMITLRKAMPRGTIDRLHALGYRLAGQLEMARLVFWAKLGEGRSSLFYPFARQIFLPDEGLISPEKLKELTKAAREKRKEKKGKKEEEKKGNGGPPGDGSSEEEDIQSSFEDMKFLKESFKETMKNRFQIDGLSSSTLGGTTGNTHTGGGSTSPPPPPPPPPSAGQNPPGPTGGSGGGNPPGPAGGTGAGNPPGPAGGAGAGHPPGNTGERPDRGDFGGRR